MSAVITVTVTGSAKSGWVYENGSYYYYENNSIAPNKLSPGEGGKLYCSDGSGKRVVNGVYTLSSKTYVFGVDGAMLTGTKRVKAGGNYYYIKSDAAVKNALAGGRAYGAAGAEYTGTKFVKVGSKYYFIKSGKIQKNKAVTYKKRGYALSKTGVKLTGNKVVTVAKKRYFVNKSGVITKKAWKKYKGKWYYASKNGELYTGTSKKIKGKKYKFNKKSVCINK